jgi:regulator of sigma D
MDKALTIKNTSASNRKGMNFCLDSVDFKTTVHFCANQVILNSLCHGSSGLEALRDIFHTLTNMGQMCM